MLRKIEHTGRLLLFIILVSPFILPEAVLISGSWLYDKWVDKFADRYVRWAERVSGLEKF